MKFTPKFKQAHHYPVIKAPVNLLLFCYIGSKWWPAEAILAIQEEKKNISY